MENILYLGFMVYCVLFQNKYSAMICIRQFLFTLFILAYFVPRFGVCLVIPSKEKIFPINEKFENISDGHLSAIINYNFEIFVKYFITFLKSLI